MSIKVGSTVRVKAPVIQGTVSGLATNGDAFGFNVSYEDTEGQGHERFFTVEQLEEVAVDQPAEGAE